MSSPVMSPPPMAPPPRRPRSFAGPFVLIIIGFVFLLSTMHVLSVGGWLICSPTTGRCC